MTHPISSYLNGNEGETLKSLSERAQVSRMQVWRLMNGRGEFTSTFLRKVSEATGGEVTVAQLAEALEETKRAKKCEPDAMARAS